MKINKRKLWYCLYDHEEEIITEDGYKTGEKRIVYQDPVAMCANISPASGASQVETFGTDVGYDRVIVTDRIHCPIDEHTVLFVDKEPEFREDGSPMYDYIVRRVARSLNSVSIAISKVTVS